MREREIKSILRHSDPSMRLAARFEQRAENFKERALNYKEKKNEKSARVCRQLSFENTTAAKVLQNYAWERIRDAFIGSVLGLPLDIYARLSNEQIDSAVRHEILGVAKNSSQPSE